MKVFSAVSVLVGAASLFTAVSAAVDPIVIKGSKFFYKTNGTQFFMQGIAYQQDYLGNGSTTSTTGSYIDPLADQTKCARDIPYLVKLRTNTIRVYALDPTVNHDACMNMLANAGIYVIADLSAPDTSINRNTPQWNQALYSRYTAVVDNMAKYTNTLGFFAGNEVSNQMNNTNASAFVKAAVRDMKAYIKNSGYRTIGVGYATNDDADIRENLADYFDCGNRASAIDFWGYNIYSWCGDSSYTLSGYDVRTAEFASYDVPVFFAEYGCNQVTPRIFTEVQALYGSQMTPVWSGGIVYMYFQEVNNFGLVSVAPNSNSVSTLADFNALSSQMAKITPSGVNSASYTPTNTAAQTCPSVGTSWGAANVLPPTPNSDLCSCMFSALACVPNNVPDSQAGALFGLVCGLLPGVCAGISANATTGVYGAYGMCNVQQQLGWALNTYYLKAAQAGNGANACNFSGSAKLVSSTKPSGSCATLISSAGTAGTATVTTNPSATGGTGGSSSTSKAAAASPMAHSSSFGLLHIALLMSVALISGGGMILL